MVTNNLGGISMDKCKKCNYSFTFYDRTKSFLDLEGLLRCPECRAIYKPKPNMYRAMYYFLVLSTYLFVFNNIIFQNFISKLVLQLSAMILTFSMFDVLPHRWHKYRKIN